MSIFDFVFVIRVTLEGTCSAARTGRGVSHSSMLDFVCDAGWVGLPWPWPPMCIFYFVFVIRDHPGRGLWRCKGGKGWADVKRHLPHQCGPTACHGRACHAMPCPGRWWEPSCPARVTTVRTCCSRSASSNWLHSRSDCLRSSAQHAPTDAPEMTPSPPSSLHTYDS